MTSQQKRPESQQRRPESILASEAERRVSTANGGRPRTQESANDKTQAFPPVPKATNHKQDLLPPPDKSTNEKLSTPFNTPRDVTDTDKVDDVIRSMVGTEAAVAAQEEDDILDDDELFMTMTPEEIEEWEKMMADREQQIEVSKEKHKDWSDSFTRRRMFASSRMRKLNLCYQTRLQLFSSVASAISQTVLQRKSVPETSTISAAVNVSGKSVTKRHSEPSLIPKCQGEAETSKGVLRRNETSVAVSLGRTGL